MEKLQKFLKENRISEADAIERIRLQDSDPAKDFYSTLVSASKQLMDAVKDKLRSRRKGNHCPLITGAGAHV